MCDHTVAFYEGNEDEKGRLIPASDEEFWLTGGIGACPYWFPDFIECFEYCPKCGEKI